jgi:hypothetical protein
VAGRACGPMREDTVSEAERILRAAGGLAYVESPYIAGEVRRLGIHR